MSEADKTELEKITKIVTRIETKQADVLRTLIGDLDNPGGVIGEVAKNTFRSKKNTEKLSSFSGKVMAGMGTLVLMLAGIIIGLLRG